MRVCSTIRVHINCIEPASRIKDNHVVPYIRIFGPENELNGKQCIVNVLGVYPYFYILPLDGVTIEQFKTRLNSALALGTINFPFPDFIHQITPCKGFDFYGYDVGWKEFWKIEMVSPFAVSKAAQLLTSNILGEFIQPYESHISYLMAFMADYNLSGCDWIEFDEFERVNGDELNVHCFNIINRKAFKQEVDHKRLFESQSVDINLGSLDEARRKDSLYREANSLPKWQPSDLTPKYQYKSLKWPWATNADLEFNVAKFVDVDGGLDTLSCTNHLQLPTAAETVNSKFKLLELDHLPVSEDFSSLSQEDVVVSTTSQQKLDLLQDIEPSVDSLNASQMLSQLASQHSYPSQSLSQLTREQTSLPFDGYIFGDMSPNTLDVQSSPGVYTTPQPFYEKVEDKSIFSFEYSGRSFKVSTHQPQDLPKFELETHGIFPRIDYYVLSEPKTEDTNLLAIELANRSPSTEDVVKWLEDRKKEEVKLKSQTQLSYFYNFQSLGTIESDDDEMSVLCLELILNKASSISTSSIVGAVCQINDRRLFITTKEIFYPGIEHFLVQDELELLKRLIDVVRSINPDILLGYETGSQSWGLCRTRYKQLTGVDEFNILVGRIQIKSANDDAVVGRYTLSLWEMLRKTVTLSQYSMEYVVLHTLHVTFPKYSFDDITAWFNSSIPHNHTFVLDHYLRRSNIILKLLSHFELISKTCAMSRIIGVDFWSSLTRGSQFKVESVLCRLTKRHNYVLISPSRQQVSHQNALEFIPLVMEPISELHTDPVCVLDFRSLYPSIVIAFNLCFSTCIGKVNSVGSRLGVKSEHVLKKSLLDQIKSEMYVMPNGVAYVSPRVRTSLLAQMLSEILDTRFMLNDTKSKSQKHTPTEDKTHDKSNARFNRNINSQQLALKLIANVTYGYTSASFSGRMPCAELADSIVSAGREILEWCVNKIENTTKWGIQAKVVYGDTDSLFVKLPKTSLDQAFKIGKEIADMITEDTPSPILLKLEKVYHPCILLAKKRYVGKAYESPHKESAFFDAKGIETVRRDGVPIVQKIEKRSLQILFDTCNLSLVKQYLQNQWRLLLAGKVSVQDLCFAQEVKLGQYKNEANLPGGAVVSLKKMKTEGIDVQYRERVPFVVCAAPPQVRINKRVISPEEFVLSSKHIIDAEYYANNVIIPPLERLFNVLGANIREWYTQMPKARIKLRPQQNELIKFIDSGTCVCCDSNRKALNSQLCSSCSNEPAETQYLLTEKLKLKERKLNFAVLKCKTCSRSCPRATRQDTQVSTYGSPPITGGSSNDTHRSHDCVNMECPVLYTRKDSYKDYKNFTNLIKQITL